MSRTYFFWDPLSDNILQERDESGTVTAEYTTEPGLYGNVISQNRGGVESQYHFDPQGSTLGLTDDNQQITDTYAYTAFGEVTEQIGSTVNPFQYVGQKGYYWDAETREYNVRRRQLSTSQGRWLSIDPLILRRFVDPLELFDALTPYLFVKNGPVTFSDPSGEITVTNRTEPQKVKCNEAPKKVLFDFDLEFKDSKGKVGAPCLGFIVQKVNVSCTVELCPKGCECVLDETKAEKFSYWEAWGIPKNKPGHVTDTVGDFPTPNDSCGHYTQTSEIRFYCLYAKDVPGKGKKNPKAGTGPLHKKWKPGTFGVTKTCGTTSINLPGTEDQNLALFWNETPVEGTATRSFDLKWDCCKEGTTPELTVKPEFKEMSKKME